MVGKLAIQEKQLYFIDRENGEKTPVRSGQCLYVGVRNAFIPVIVKYSLRDGAWYFENMPDLGIENSRILIKAS